MLDEQPEEVRGCSRYEWERIVRRVVMPTATVKAVALTLATYANADGTSIYPGNDRLAAVTCAADKTVRRSLEWLRAGFLIERVREGSRNGRGGVADEYRLTISSDLLVRHKMLPPDESPVTMTGDRQEHRSPRPVPPVTVSGTPVTEDRNTGHGDRTPTHYQPLPTQDQRDDLVPEVTTEGASDLLARLIAIDELAARRKATA